MIEKLEGARDGTGRYAATFNQLEAALQLHMREEEKIYYPALAQHEEFRDILDDSVPEHEMVKQQLAQMGELAPSGPEFQELLAEMKTALEAHMTNEEDEIFPDPDPYMKDVLHFGLLEDFDHLYRYSQMLDLIEGKDPEEITQGKTDIFPGARRRIITMNRFYGCGSITRKIKRIRFQKPTR